ncbi:MAG TPA: glycosyltransferase family 4 protein [Gaiellaceae bacterium]|nr:glycosyltransferase family 4 protein [Gaiellaceae bacterium]
MPERPRLLVLITLAEIGGAQSYVMHLLPALTETFDVTVAAWGPGPLRAAAESAGARYVPLAHVRRPISPLHDALGLLELYRLCRKLRPNIVHANSSKAGILGRLAAWLAGVPTRVFTVHGWAFAAYSGRASTVYLVADRLMRPLTTRMICVADNELRKGLAARTCDAEKTVVIRNAIDVQAAPHARPHESARIVFVGRLKYPKDGETLLRATAALGDRPYELVIVGDGPDRTDLETLQHRLGLDERVRFAGERDDVPQLLADAGVFVLASRSEGLPISVLEAMAAGLPVVASDVGGLREQVVDGETGYLVPAGDVTALTDALARLLDDPALRERIGAAARARAEELFDLPAFRRAHVDLYRSLL